MMEQNLTFLAKDETRQLVERLCSEENIDFSTFRELIEAELKQMGKQRKSGLYPAFDDILSRIFEADL